MTAPALHMRVGDELPSISCQIIDDAGVVVPIPKGTDAYILIRATWARDPSYVFVADVVDDVITYDWQDEDAARLEQGAYDFSVGVDLPDGTHIVAPSDHHAELIVGPRVLTETEQ